MKMLKRENWEKAKEVGTSMLIQAEIDMAVASNLIKTAEEHLTETELA